MFSFKKKFFDYSKKRIFYKKEQNTGILRKKTVKKAGQENYQNPTGYRCCSTRQVYISVLENIFQNVGLT